MAHKLVSSSTLLGSPHTLPAVLKRHQPGTCNLCGIDLAQSLESQLSDQDSSPFLILTDVVKYTVPGLYLFFENDIMLLVEICST